MECACEYMCVWSSCVEQCIYSVNANNGVQILTRSIKSWQAAALLCCGSRKDVTGAFLQSEACALKNQIHTTSVFGVNYLSGIKRVI